MSAASNYAAVVACLEHRDASPLDTWQFALPRAREVVSLLDECDELYARAANKAGKTEWAAALVLAMLQKREMLDGARLPQWRGPVAGIVLSLDFQAQKLSVQQTLLRLLGRWPHHKHWKGDGILSSLSIKPVGAGDDESEWSTLTLMSQENRASGVGARADIVWADEPPLEEVWREVRKAAHAGRRAVRLISATPTKRRQWAWLRDEFGDTPRSSIRRVSQDVAEVRWSLHEVEDWVLTKTEKAKLLRSYANDPLERGDRKARSHGDYVDASGLCPFNVEALEAMLRECQEPKVKDWDVREEGAERMHKSTTVQVEVFGEPARDRRYWMSIDPSSGIDDNAHDPWELEISEMGTGDLVARAGGRMSGKLVGILASGLARQYNNAVIDIEVNDKWGVNVLEGCHAAKYANLAREPRELSPGKIANEIGFHNNQATRPLIIGAVQSWVDSWASGNRYARCPSKFILNTLLDCILDENNKIVAAPGLHDEALICWGENLRRAVTRSGKPMQAPFTPARTPDQKLADRILGRRQGMAIPGGVPALKPKARP